MRACPSLTAVVFTVVLFGGPTRPSAQPIDGGPPRDGTADKPDAALAPADPATRTSELDVHAQKIKQLEAELSALSREEAALRALKATEPQLPKEQASLFEIELSDPDAVARRLVALDKERRSLERRIREHGEQLAAMEPLLKPSVKRLAALRKRKQRNPRFRIPEAVLRRGEAAERQLTLLRLELDLATKRSANLVLRRKYLEASQSARTELKRKQETEAEQLRASQLTAEKEQQQALAETARAERAQRAALEAQRRARTEAERNLAAERARLEGVRAQQARVKQQLARQLASIVKLRARLDLFRGRVAARSEELKERWPATAPDYDRLYGQVVAELIKLRPMAVTELKNAIRGLEDPPHPGERLRRTLYDLDKAYEGEVQRLESKRRSLAEAAGKLSQQQSAIVDERLTLLRREITGLNEHRLRLLQRVTRDKRRALVGLTRETVDQLGREVTQLVFDGLYWAFSRLRQIDEVPRLIVDVFTVGSLLWKLVKVILLLTLLRFVLRRWQRWMEPAVRRIGRSVSLGRNAVRLAKLADAVRFGGPALLVLVVAMAIYGILGGDEAAPELHVVYIVIFWTALYRLQLRLVESGARYIGVGPGIRADLPAEPPPEQDQFQDQEAETGGPATEEKQASGEEKPPVPVPVLLVRSVRAATRYLLAVLLVLDLTALAVGKGTLYGLTAGFSWWAAVPFVFYFLLLWQPHIVRAYERLGEGRPRQGALARLVSVAQGRFYGVLVVGAAFLVVLANKLVSFIRRYFTSLDATKKLLAFLFRRQVEKHAQQQGRVVTKRQDLPDEILAQFPDYALGPGQHPARRPFMDEVKEVFNTWKEDQNDGSVVLVGRAGMGKSTTLRLLEQELETTVLHGDVRTKVTRPAKIVSWLAEVFGFSPRPSSERDLVRMIREDKHPVVAVDNCHNLFLRQVNGFKGWETFVRIVNETCDNVFWLLTFNQAAWEYLNNIAGRVHYFRRLIQMPGWSEGEIRSLIMQRMRRARFGVSFSDLVVTQVEGLSVAAQLGRTSAGYFRLLWDLTDGNPRLAGHFWLDSLVPRSDRRVVQVHLFASPQLEELDKLSDDILFVLTAVSEHQNLTAAEAASVTNLSPDFCKFAFKFCVEQEYLEQGRDDGRFRLSRRWQVPVVRFLKRQHLLYG